MSNKDWDKGVQDSIKCIESQLRTLRLFNNDSMRAHPAGVAVLEDALIHLRSLLDRQGIPSRATLMSTGESAHKEGHYIKQAVVPPSSKETVRKFLELSETLEDIVQEVEDKSD